MSILSKLIYLLPRIIVYSIFLIFLFLSFLTYFSYFEPYLYPLHLIKGKAKYVKKNVIIGPNPNKRELKILKEKLGITVVISLLNPNLLPEKSLLNEELKNTKELGLKFFNYPLEYFNLNSEYNLSMVQKLKSLIDKNPQETFYIHCYLGKHRTKLVEKYIKNETSH
jgi:hypothetical protein